MEITYTEYLRLKDKGIPFVDKHGGLHLLIGSLCVTVNPNKDEAENAATEHL